MRVLAINDVSCVGRCSLTVSLPVISACGVTCDVLPTALLSTHTGGFQGYTFLDLSSEMEKITAHWRALGLRFSHIYSGYLGNAQQIDLVLAVRREFLEKDGVFIVDPVMGDGGKLYDGFNEEYVEKMKTLCKEAIYVLPNLTEACYLADISYASAPTGEAIVEKLRSLCARPIVTGIVSDDKISTYYATDDGVSSLTHENVDGFFHGAGDVFASAFVGALAKGKTESEAIAIASDFTAAAIRRSATETDKRFGLNFEAELPYLVKKINA